MTVGCFSGLWCYRQPPSSDVAPAGAAPSSDLAPTGAAPSSDLAPTGAAQSVLPSSRPPIQLDPSKAKEHISRIKRFRILVMGRANAGKTSVLQRVCNTTDQPEISNGQGLKVDATVVQGSLMRGYHNIEDELVFASNPGFVFHDSCGFEVGSVEQFDMMKNFVMDRAKSIELEKRVHAIWFCIPLTDRHRMTVAAEKKFFDCCDTGHVPVIVLLTKADTLSLDAFEEVMEHHLSVDDALQAAQKVEDRHRESALVMVQEWMNKQRFPPHDYLTLAGMQEEGADCTSLITCTANALNEEGLQQLLISTQQSNLELCMEFAIMKALKNCMGNQKSKLGPSALASTLVIWFPYKWGYARPPPEAEEFREAFELVDDQLVPDIPQSLYNLNMPTLSDSVTYSMQYTAEQGIGTILVLEYLYFLLQEGKNDLLVDLDLAVGEYHTSGTREFVCKHIKKAFQEHGENMQILCPILVQVAKENQMSRNLNRKA